MNDMKHEIQTKLLIKNNSKIVKNYDPDSYANELIKDFVVNYDVKCFNVGLQFDDFSINSKKIMILNKNKMCYILV